MIGFQHVSKGVAIASLIFASLGASRAEPLRFQICYFPSDGTPNCAPSNNSEGSQYQQIDNGRASFHLLSVRKILTVTDAQFQYHCVFKTPTGADSNLTQSAGKMCPEDVANSSYIKAIKLSLIGSAANKFVLRYRCRIGKYQSDDHYMDPNNGGWHHASSSGCGPTPDFFWISALEISTYAFPNFP